jgi:hypothetical protein
MVAAAKYMQATFADRTGVVPLPLVLVGMSFGGPAAWAAAAKLLCEAPVPVHLAGVAALGASGRGGSGFEDEGLDTVACVSTCAAAGVPALFLHGSSDKNVALDVAFYSYNIFCRNGIGTADEALCEKFGVTVGDRVELLADIRQSSGELIKKGDVGVVNGFHSDFGKVEVIFKEGSVGLRTLQFFHLVQEADVEKGREAQGSLIVVPGSVHNFSNARDLAFPVLKGWLARRFRSDGAKGAAKTSNQHPLVTPRTGAVEVRCDRGSNHWTLEAYSVPRVTRSMLNRPSVKGYSEKASENASLKAVSLPVVEPDDDGIAESCSDSGESAFEVVDRMDVALTSPTIF